MTRSERSPRVARMVLIALTLLGATAGSAPQATSQAEFGLGAGVAVPLYEAADGRSPGLHLLGYGDHPISRRFQLRGEVMLSQFRGRPDSGRSDDVRITGASALLVYAPLGSRDGFYAFGGIGGYAVANDGGDGSATAAGLNLGIGGNLWIGPLAVFGQTRVQVPFTTVGTGTESAPLTYLPLALGIRFPCCGERAR